MTPLDRLQELLDERGVKYKRESFWNRTSVEYVTWRGVGGIEFNAIRSLSDPDMLYIYNTIISPEDAITATIGRGACHLVETEHEREVPYDLLESKSDAYYTEVTYDCDECGYENLDYNVRYCGGCGRRVVE